MALKHCFILLISSLQLIPSCKPAQLSEAQEIIGTITISKSNTSEYSDYLGSFGTAPGSCTAFAMNQREIATANHCITDSNLSSYFLFGKNRRHRISTEPDVVPVTRIRGADVAFVRLDNEDNPFTTFFQFAPWDLSSPSKLVSSDGDQFYTANQTEVFGFESTSIPGLYMHSLDTIQGFSGSPIIQSGRAVAVHLGSIKDFQDQESIVTK